MSKRGSGAANTRDETHTSPSLWMESKSGQSYASHWRQNPATRGSLDAWQSSQRDHHMAVRTCDREFTRWSCIQSGSDDAKKMLCSARSSATTPASAADRCAGGVVPHAASAEFLKRLS